MSIVIVTTANASMVLDKIVMERAAKDISDQKKILSF